MRYYSVSAVSFSSPPRGHVDGVPPLVSSGTDRAKSLIRLIATDFCRGEIEVVVTIITSSSSLIHAFGRGRRKTQTDVGYGDATDR